MIYKREDYVYERGYDVLEKVAKKIKKQELDKQCEFESKYINSPYYNEIFAGLTPQNAYPVYEELPTFITRKYFVALNFRKTHAILTDEQRKKVYLYIRGESKVYRYNSQHLPISEFHEGFAVICDKSKYPWKYGFVNSEGQVIIPPMYENIMCFNEGLAAVKKDGLWGFINKNNEVVIPFEYEGVNYFKEDLAAVKFNGHWGFINKNNEVVIPFEYDDDSLYNSRHLFDRRIYEFNEGLATVVINGKASVINRNNECVIPADYEYISIFENNRAIAEKKGYKAGYYLLDNRGNIINPNDKYDYIKSLGQGVYLATRIDDCSIENGKLIDQDGYEITPFSPYMGMSTETCGICDGKIVVHTPEGEYRYINISNGRDHGRDLGEVESPKTLYGTKFIIPIQDSNYFSTIDCRAEMIEIKEPDYDIYRKKVQAIEEILRSYSNFNEHLCSVLDKHDVSIQKTYCLK